MCFASALLRHNVMHQDAARDGHVERVHGRGACLPRIDPQSVNADEYLPSPTTHTGSVAAREHTAAHLFFLTSQAFFTLVLRPYPSFPRTRTVEPVSL
jgi:hypothetical protein